METAVLSWEQALVGIVAAIVLELLKKLRGVPLESGQTTRLRIVAGVFSIVGTLGLRLSQGGALDDQFLTTIAGSLASYFVASMTYFSILKK